MAKDIDCAGQSVVDSVAQDVIDRFAEGLSHLSVVRSAAAELQGTVDALVALIDRDGMDDTGDEPLAAFLVHAKVVLERASEAAGLLSEGSFGEALQEMAGDLDALAHRATEMRSATYLTKIVCAENIAADGSLDNFVATLEDSATQLKTIGEQTSRSVSAVRKASTQAGGALAGLATEFDGLVATAREELAELQDLEQAHVARTTAAQQSSRHLADQVKQSISRLVDCLQFADAFSQRREHVVAMVDARERSGCAAERNALGRLSAAHLDAMAQDLERVTNTARDALGAILDALSGAPIGAQARGDDPSAVWLSAARDNNRMMQEAAETGRTRLDQSLRQVDEVLTHIETAVAGLETSADLNANLENSARNAAIAASRAGDSGGGLRVLARNVRELVIETTALIDRLTAGLGLVRRVSDDLKAANLQDELLMLDKIQSDANRIAEQQACMLGGLQEQQTELSASVGRIAEAARQAINAFVGAAGEGTKLCLLASEQGQVLDGAEADTEEVDLSWVFALYTMEDERAVHRAVFPNSPDAISATANAQDEDDDDLDGFLI
jgi:methyl-accepting chemotaxis protein